MIDSAEAPLVTAERFRHVLGHYPTGVVAVTSMAGDEPLGMAVGSFTSVSLDPPLVGFLPARSSDSWPKIQATGRFAVNVLGRHQESVCRAMSRKQDKFIGVDWHRGGHGCPIIDEAVAWVECDLYSVVDAGDHYFAQGRVARLQVSDQVDPLVFFRSAYGGLAFRD